MWQVWQLVPYLRANAGMAWAVEVAPTMPPMIYRETKNDERIFMQSRFATVGPAIEEDRSAALPRRSAAPVRGIAQFLLRERRVAANRAPSRWRECRLGSAHRREHEAAEHAERDEHVAYRDR